MLTRRRGEPLLLTIRRNDSDSAKISPPLPLEMIKSLGLLNCSKKRFDEIAKTLCTISKADLQEDEVVAEPVTLPNKLTHAEKQKLKKQKMSNPPKPNSDESHPAT